MSKFLKGTKEESQKKKSKFEMQSEESGSEQETETQSKQKVKGSKFQVQQQSGSENGSEQEEDIKTQSKNNGKSKKSKFEVQNSQSEEEEDEKEKNKKKNDQSKNKKKSKFEVQQQSEEEEEVESEKESKKQDKKSKKSKFEVQNSEESEKEETQQKIKGKKSKFEVQNSEESEQEEKESKKQDKNKKKSKFEVANDDEEKANDNNNNKKKVLTKEEKLKLKKQKQKQQESEDELDQLLNENKKQEEKEEEEENEQQETGAQKDGEKQEKSKAQLKREKKKLKEKMEKEGVTVAAGDDQENKEQEDEEKESKNKKKKDKKKPMNKAALIAMENLRKKEEEEKIYQQKLKEAQEAEERRIQAEIEAEEEKKRLKEEEKKKKKAEGTYETRAQKKKREQLEKARQQFALIQAANSKGFVQSQVQQSVIKEQPDEKQNAQKKKQEAKQHEQEEEEEEKQENENKNENENEDLEDWELELEKEAKKEEEAKAKALEQKKQQVGGKKKKKSSDDLLTDSQIPKEEIYGMKAPKAGVLRSPIICIMGHVDTGKTTLLDKLRHTNVQGNEAGGITQQIGATFFPGEKIKEQIVKCEKHYKAEVKAPGLLIIDTPGHESFANLRSRGSGLCDFAILVIDLMHGLEQQTLESIKLLTLRKTPFVIALNKIDRCYDWKSKEFESSYSQLNKQKANTKQDFQTRYQKVVTQLMEIEKNAILYWENQDIKSFFPIVPTSGVTGEGIPDLLSVIIKYTSFFMRSRMMVKEDAFNCTVMEVKMIEGHGTTIDCVLIDGILRKGDTVTVLGFNGAITTKIRALLTPHPMKEMRVKGEYIQHDVIYAAMGLKIAAKGLEDCVAGSQLLLSNTPEEQQEAVEIVEKDLDDVKQKIKLSDHGVGVAASTLGSLEALLAFLKESKIPVSYVTIGPVSRDDINKAMKALLADEPQNRKKEYATMLVFDIKVLKEAKEYAEQQGVKIFEAQIIYHLQDQYLAYHNQCIEERRQQHIKDAIFPCVLKVVQIFRANKPLIIGVNVQKGQLRIGTPLVAVVDGQPKIGIVDSMESNGKPVKNGIAKKETGDIAIKVLEHGNTKGGQTFDVDAQLVSLISRYSIDCLKEHFKDQVSKEEWKLIRDNLKPFFNIY